MSRAILGPERLAEIRNACLGADVVTMSADEALALVAAAEKERRATDLLDRRLLAMPAARDDSTPRDANEPPGCPFDEDVAPRESAHLDPAAIEEG